MIEESMVVIRGDVGAAVRIGGRAWRGIAAALVGAGMLTQLGCSSAVWRPQIESVSGEYRNTQAMSNAATELVEGGAEDVKAIVMQLPPGIELQGEVLKVDAEKYDVLGKVSAKPANDFFYPYREHWRRPLCYPQKVLVVATLFIWNIVPTYWPCFVTIGTENDRRDRIIEAMKRATKSMGGNMVLVGGFNGMIMVTANQTSAVVSTLEAVEGVGWAIKVKAPNGASPPAAMPAAPTAHR
jgi:hypothetical protein